MRRGRRWLPVIIVVLLVTASSTAQTAANTVSGTKVDDDSRTIGANDLSFVNPAKFFVVAHTDTGDMKMKFKFRDTDHDGTLSTLNDQLDIICPAPVRGLLRLAARVVAVPLRIRHLLYLFIVPLAMVHA